MTGYGDLEYRKNPWLTSDENKKLKSLIEERSKIKNKVKDPRKPTDFLADSEMWADVSRVDELEREYDRLKTLGSLRQKYGWG